MCTNNSNCTCTDNTCGCKTSTSEVVYQGPALTCVGINNCDTITEVLQQLNSYICSEELVTIIINNIINNIDLYQQFTTIVNNSVECETVWGCETTTSTTTIATCESFLLENTGVDPVAIIITNCDTNTQEAIVLMPGDTNICVVTDSPLTVPGTVIVTPTGPCVPPTSSTTSTSSTSSTTTTTTTEIPCECLTFTNTDPAVAYAIFYLDCTGDEIGYELPAKTTIKFCGSEGSANSELVTISIGGNCIDRECPTTTTTTTIAITSICFCIFGEGVGCEYTEELPILGNAPFQNGRPVYDIGGDLPGSVYYDGSQWIYASQDLAPLLQPLLNASYYPIGTYSEWGDAAITGLMNSSTSGPCPTTTTTSSSSTTTTTTTAEPTTTTTSSSSTSTSTSTSSTTTSTTTIPPTTTTTTTVIYSAGFSVGTENNALACLETVAVITLYSTSSTFAFGSFVYTDPGLTTIFVGGNLNYKNLAANNGIRIPDSGQINSTFSC